MGRLTTGLLREPFVFLPATTGVGPWIGSPSSSMPATRSRRDRQPSSVKSSPEVPSSSITTKPSKRSKRSPRALQASRSSVSIGTMGTSTGPTPQHITLAHVAGVKTKTLRVGVQQAQEFGVRVHPVGIRPSRGSQSGDSGSVSPGMRTSTGRTAQIGSSAAVRSNRGNDWR
jgi:hypothetical protein